MIHLHPRSYLMEMTKSGHFQSNFFFVLSDKEKTTPKLIFGKSNNDADKNK